MKKFSKMLALAMTLALALGVTAFAADSVTVSVTGISNEAAAQGVAGTTSDGQAVTIKQLEADQATAAIEELQTAGVGDTILSVVGGKSKVNNIEPKVAKAFDADLANVKGTVELTFSWEGLSNSKVYAALHQKKDGNWEVVAAVVENGKLSIKLTGLSPIVIVEVGDVVSDSGNNNNNNTDNSNNNNNSSDNSSNNEEPKSPATGETLPIIGIMALICLAGAAVCAGKVRYNKQ